MINNYPTCDYCGKILNTRYLQKTHNESCNLKLDVNEERWNPKFKEVLFNYNVGDLWQFGLEEDNDILLITDKCWDYDTPDEPVNFDGTKKDFPKHCRPRRDLLMFQVLIGSSEYDWHWGTFLDITLKNIVKSPYSPPGNKQYKHDWDYSTKYVTQKQAEKLQKNL